MSLSPIDWLVIESPRPRESALPLEGRARLTGEATYLPWLDQCSSPVLSVMRARRSRTPKGNPATSALSALLWHAGKTLEVVPRGPGTPWKHRVPPSAGGCHPVRLFVMDWPVTAESPSEYDDIAHALVSCNWDPVVSAQWQAAIAKAVPADGRGKLLWFGIEWRRTASRYEHGETLAWRDVGSVVATLAFVAEALGLAGLPIGLTGEPEFSRLFGGERDLIGGGGFLFGLRSDIGPRPSP
jgi:hypothetical protein